MTDDAAPPGRSSVGRIVVMAILAASALFASLRYLHVVSHSDLNELRSLRGEMSEEPWPVEREAEFRRKLDEMASKVEGYRPEEKARYLFIHAHWLCRASRGGDLSEGARLYREALALDLKLAHDEWLAADVKRLKAAGVEGWDRILK